MLLGIDIGGTTINFGLVSDRKITGTSSVPSFNKDATLPETIEYLSHRISEVITPEVESIGIGVPTLVDPARGIVYNAANIPSWKEVHLRDELEKRFGIPVAVNNDANCFALGAAAVADALNDVMVGITLGTGLGIGIVVDGRLMCGANCGAGELCSVPYEGDEFESFCSQKFFVSQGWDSRRAVAATEASDPGALSFFEQFGHHLGKLLSLVMYAYDPSCIVFGGGISNTFPCFEEPMKRTLRENYIYPHALERLRILAMPQNDIALLGASLL